MPDMRLINALCDCGTCQGGFSTCEDNKRIYGAFRGNTGKYRGSVCIHYKRIARTPRRVSRVPGEVILSQGNRMIEIDAGEVDDE